jgi:hypothetical protein
MPRRSHTFTIKPPTMNQSPFEKLGPASDHRQHGRTRGTSDELMRNRPSRATSFVLETSHTRTHRCRVWNNISGALGVVACLAIDNSPPSAFCLALRQEDIRCRRRLHRGWPRPPVWKLRHEPTGAGKRCSGRISPDISAPLGPEYANPIGIRRENCASDSAPNGVAGLITRTN